MTDLHRDAPSGEGPLAGVTVLDLGRIVAAPHCALLLGNLGAEVIKVERPGAGDDARSNAFRHPNGESGYFMQQNWGKRSMVLDLKTDAGASVLRQLVRRCDVLIENFRPGTMASLGLDWEQLRQVNDQLVMCSISAYGQTGPDAMLPGYGALAEARSAIPELTGERDGPPMPSFLSIADMLGASHAFGAICAALHARHRSGRGDYIDIALLDCVVEMQDWAFQQFLGSDGEVVPSRHGLVDEAIVPWGYFQTGDGRWLCLIVSNDSFWNRLAALLGRPELARHPDFATVAARSRNRHEVYRLVSAWIRDQQDCDAAVADLRASGLPVERLRSVAEVVEDPHLAARDMFPQMPHPDLGRLRVVNTAPRFASSRAGLRGRPPLLGEHTEQILVELGYSAVEIDALRAQGALGSEREHGQKASVPSGGESG